MQPESKEAKIVEFNFDIITFFYYFIQLFNIYYLRSYKCYRNIILLNLKNTKN